MLPHISASSTILIDYLRKTEFPPLRRSPCCWRHSSCLTSILATCLTDAFSPRSSEPSCFLAVRTVLSPIGDRLRMFMTVYKLAFIPNKSLRSLQFGRGPDWCVVAQPSEYEHVCGKTRRATRKPHGEGIARGLLVGTKPNSARGADLAERVRSILASKDLTLSQISKVSVARFGRSSVHFLPHTLYHEFRLGAFSPSLHQVFAFSQLSGYQFFDWLRVFGCDPENIPRLQVLLTSKRTMLLDSSLVDADAWIPWLRNRSCFKSALRSSP